MKNDLAIRTTARSKHQPKRKQKKTTKMKTVDIEIKAMSQYLFTIHLKIHK